MRKFFDNEQVKKAVSILGSRNNLAKKLNISYQTVSDWVNNKKTPSPENCEKIEEATGGQVTRQEILPDFPWGN